MALGKMMDKHTNHQTYQELFVVILLALHFNFFFSFLLPYKYFLDNILKTCVEIMNNDT